MNKSELFKAAHKLAKETLRSGDSYSATFSICLKVLLQESKNTIKNFITSIEMLSDALNADSDTQGNVWQNYGKNRIYVKAANQHGHMMDAGFLEVSEDSVEFIEGAGKAARWASSFINHAFEKANINVIV